MASILLDIERARAILDAEDVDVLIACRPENFTYISGVARPLEHCYVREHTTYALLSREGQTALIVPFFEQETVCQESWVADVVPFRQYPEATIDQQSYSHRGGSAEAVAAAKISEMAHPTGRIGFDEKYTPVRAYELLQEQLPRAHFVPVSCVFERLRQVKTATEIARLTEAARVVAKAYRSMWDRVTEGVTERQLATAARQVFLGEGAPRLSFMNCGAGVRSSIEHLPASDYAVRSGDLIRFDMGVCVQGYHSDIGRTFACGTASPEQAKIYAKVLNAFQQVVAAMKPGVTGSHLFEIYRRGMGEYFAVTPQEWVGHGCGLELHEPPFLGPTMHDPLEPGMVLAIEIVLIPGREGYHVEDEFLITGDGNRRLIDLPNDTLDVAAMTR